MPQGSHPRSPSSARAVQIRGHRPFEVPGDEIGRNMLDDDRFRAAVSGFDFGGHAVAVIGGGGFVGLHIAKLFGMCGFPPAQIRLVDVAPPHQSEPPVIRVDGTKAVFVRGDIACEADVDAAIAGCSVVVQVASYGMSGREMLDVPRILAVNVDGTKHVIAACRKHGVRALIYTSSVNAVFTGRTFTNACDLPYPPLPSFADTYSRTKSEAEQLVRAANNRKSGGSAVLRTVALRMCGIYGVGERRHFPRIIRLTRMGLTMTTIGGLETQQDWVSVANASFAHVLAAHRLLIADAVDDTKVAGGAFPITEHCPVNQFLMLEPLFSAVGVALPRLHLPVPIAVVIATASDIALRALRPLYAAEPLLTVAEVQKVGVTHTFSPKAALALGYRPVVPFHEGIARTLAAFAADIEKSDAARGKTSSAAASGIKWAALLDLRIIAALLVAAIYLVAAGTIFVG